jgi:hypothetical protein
MISDGTTNFTNVSVASALAASNISSTASILVNALWASSVSFGGQQLGGASGIGLVQSTASLVAPFVVQGSASSFTIVVWSAVAPGDMVNVFPLPGGAVSSISSGLVAHSHCTQAGQVEFRLSNVSTLAQNQSQRTWVFVATRSGFVL